MKMKDIPTTTPFEDLILGSQFVPVLASANTIKGDKGDWTTAPNIGVFQCHKCRANFLEEEEALLHYKSHVLETHKEYFSVVLGGLCSKKGCVFMQRKDPSIHFHCSHCQFSACEVKHMADHTKNNIHDNAVDTSHADVEIMFYWLLGHVGITGNESVKEHGRSEDWVLDLPLHMEKQHLSFYKEVSLVLSKEDAQLNKVYRCGECDLSIQGEVSILQHLLTHEAANPSIAPSRPAAMELAAWKPLLSENGSHLDPVALVNGVDNHYCLLSREDDGTDNRTPLRETSPSFQEQIQVEINPLDLLSTILEEDMRSDNPVLPTQHFLLGHPAGLEDPPSIMGYKEEDNLSSGGDTYSLMEDLDQPLVNGFYESSAPGVFQCDQCPEAFKYQYLLMAHRKQRHESSVVTPFRCCVCGNEFTVLSDLKRHASAVGHAPDPAHFCPVCGHAFSAVTDLKQHLLDHSKGNRRTVSSPAHLLAKNGLSISSVMEKTICDGCSMEFATKSELTRHIVKYQGTCNPNKTEGLKCATCGEEMTTLEALKEHRRLAHPPSPTGDPTRVGVKKGFQCDYCGKNFSCRSNLRDHLVVHTGEKPYPCDICGKAFSFIHNMKTHRLTHNEGRNEVCPYCDKAYKSKISLYYHMKKGNCRGLSTKEVPEGFSRCTECLQMFASEERFQSHKAKGTCQMSYRCIHCGIRCSTQEKLEKHLQKGNCTKSSSSASATISSERQRRRAAARRRAEEEPICCERCNNYNRDCCCTFSCGKCGKRVFSIGAFLGHKRLHLRPRSPEGGLPDACPPPLTVRAPKRKERIIRTPSVERHRRKKRRRGRTKAPKKESLPVEPTLEEEKPSGDPPVLPEDHPISSEESPSISLEPTVASATVLEGDAPPAPTLASPEDDLRNDEEDSNSGSLTDLSSFTTPNLLLKSATPVGSTQG